MDFSNVSWADWFIFALLVCSFCCMYYQCKKTFSDLIPRGFRKGYFEEFLKITYPSNGQLVSYLFFTTIDDALWLLFLFAVIIINSDDQVKIVWLHNHPAILKFVNALMYSLLVVNVLSNKFSGSFEKRSLKFLEELKKGIHDNIVLRIMDAYWKQFFKLGYLVAFLLVYDFTVKSFLVILVACFTVFDVVARNAIGWKKFKLYMEIARSCKNKEEVEQLESAIKDVKEEDIHDF